MELLELPAGKRVAICGATGSGKSTLARLYLGASRYHWVIFNPKWSRAYDGLGGNKLSRITEAALRKSLDRYQYTILNFPGSWGGEAQDELIGFLTENYEGIGICIDELYTIHTSARPGPGLTGLLTRGRELRQSFLGCTQRPVWISGFVFSEADAIIEFRLTYDQDRKRVYEYVGNRAALDKLTGYDYLYFDVAADRTTIYRA